MNKNVKVINQAGMPVQDLFFEVENNNFSSDRNGDLNLQCQNPNSVVKINYLGSEEIRTTIAEIGSQIVVDNGFRLENCKSKNVSLDYLSKEIRLLDKKGNPLAGIEVFSESGLTNTVTDNNGQATVKVTDPEEYINFDAQNIQGEAMAFKSLSQKIELQGYSTVKSNIKKPINANGWFFSLLGIGFVYNLLRNQDKPSPIKKMIGMGKPVKITL
jgi:hypothetical protein